MTGPTPRWAAPRQTPSPQVDPTAAEAMQHALATEHAALWCYSLAVAFLAKDRLEQAQADAREHLALRGALQRALTGVGVPPVTAQPAYAVPEPVTDPRSAVELLVVAETDTLAAWRSVLERSAQPSVRRPAIKALTEATLRCARWRVVVGRPPAIPLFPGAPDPA